ncbi:hypothetical protein Q7C36_000707 [Tachysurus vachellii]|uniref:Uncharacterized protein n=1 Tax=Tachysurus vachellii TaxID=175792 RepID=A0AA88TJ22_TACVA|nr:hypothetical protein Q7C36_000707 [Tachysurus vachellii]
MGDLLIALIDSQQPLEGIPDDDHMDSSDGAPVQSSFDDHVSLEGPREGTCQPTTSEAARREDGVANLGRKPKRQTIQEKLTMDYHEHKLKYLKEEHEIKMKIFNIELALKEEERNMKQQQILGSEISFV